MTAAIANILKVKLSEYVNDGLDGEGNPHPDGLLWVDKLAGLVQTGERSQPTQIEGAFAITKFPISLDVNYEDCVKSGCFQDLVPNSKFKGILYFESLSTVPGPVRHGSYEYSTKLRLVSWINNKLIQGDSCTNISHILISQIRKQLESGTFNSGHFTKISVKANNIIDNDLKLFSRYTYPNEILKYLIHPYEAFGIDYTVNYIISQNCINDITLNPVQC